MLGGKSLDTTVYWELTDRQHGLVLAIHTRAIAKVPLLIFLQLQQKKIIWSYFIQLNLLIDSKHDFIITTFRTINPEQGAAPSEQCRGWWGCSAHESGRTASQPPAQSGHSDSGCLPAPRLAKTHNVYRKHRNITEDSSEHAAEITYNKRYCICTVTTHLITHSFWWSPWLYVQYCLGIKPIL